MCDLLFSELIKEISELTKFCLTDEDFEEADPDETDFGLANDGEEDDLVAFEQNLVFRIDNEETSQKIGE